MTDEIEKEVEMQVEKRMAELEKRRESDAELEKLKADLEKSRAELEAANAQIEKLKTEKEEPPDDEEDDEEEEKKDGEENEGAIEERVKETESNIDTLATAIEALEPGTEEAIEQAVELAEEVKEETANIEEMKAKAKGNKDLTKRLAKNQNTLSALKAGLFKKLQTPIQKSRSVQTQRIQKHGHSASDYADEVEEKFSQGQTKEGWKQLGIERARL